MKQNVLLTGYTGYIGSKLFSLLKESDDIGEVFVNNDIMNSELPDVDLVYHLGAKVDPKRSITDPFWDLENIPTSLKIAMRYKDKKIIYTSSDATNEPFKYPYGISKLAGEHYIKFFCKNAIILKVGKFRDPELMDKVKNIFEAKDYNTGTYII